MDHFPYYVYFRVKGAYVAREILRVLPAVSERSDCRGQFVDEPFWNLTALTTRSGQNVQKTSPAAAAVEEQRVNSPYPIERERLEARDVARAVDQGHVPIFVQLVKTFPYQSILCD